MREAVERIGGWLQALTWLERPLIASCVGGQLDGDRSVLVPWWSITKTCLAACALVLVAGGRPEHRPARCAGRRFALRQLLQHTSGLAATPMHRDYEVALDGHEDPWTDDASSRCRKASAPLFEPSEQGWTYSDSRRFPGAPPDRADHRDRHRARAEPLVLEPLGVSRTGSSRARAPICDAASAAIEDNFHPGWVGARIADGAAGRMSRCSCTRLFTGACCRRRCATRCASAIRSTSDLPDRPWRTRATDSVSMMDIASPHGALHRPFGGRGPTAWQRPITCPIVDPPLTVAAFAPTDDQGIAERAVLTRPAAALRAARLHRRDCRSEPPLGSRNNRRGGQCMQSVSCDACHRC